MPYTPFHVPPAAVAGWPLRGHLDLPTFLLASVVVDVEPLVMTLLDLGPPPHAYAHTLLGGAVVGAATGWVVWRVRRRLESALRGRYPLRRRVAVLSGIAGCWLHVALDAAMYDHIRPFYPLAANPLYWPGSYGALHWITGLLIVPAAALFVRHRHWRTLPQKLSFALLVLAGVGIVVALAAGAV